MTSETPVPESAMSRLEGKTAVVVGGSGIGRAIVLRFAQEGARVLVTGTSGKQDQLAAEAPERICAMHCDLAKPDDVAAVFSTAQARLGRIDIVVNNAAATIPTAPLHEVPLEDWDHLMAINLRGGFLILKEAAPRMMTHGGSIINIGSTASFRATAGSGPYATSKGGLVMLTRSAALDYAKFNIRVNALCPGTTDTPRLERLGEERIAQLAERIPLGRLCAPEEVAALATFLASDEASYITGQAYLLDGGRFAG
jgi:NAD(P)-dependent dehydrogenase (short-subunit alcohol dehydrogenase family)